MNYNPYTDVVFGPELRKLFRNSGKEVRHREECPICKRTHVNIYKKDGQWKCKQCWDED